MPLATLYDNSYEVVAPSQQIVDVVWLDVNTRLGQSGKPDLLPEVQAINNSLYNLFRCPIGARGRTFQPEYGTLLWQFIHEPLDYVTAADLYVSLIQAIQRWEPRIELDMSRTGVEPDFGTNAFVVTISYQIVSSQLQGRGTFVINRSSVQS